MELVTIFSNPEVLKAPTEPFNFRVEGTQIEARDLAKEMVEIMNKNKGVGLAANQVGVSKQLFVMKGLTENLAVINPRIVDRSSDTTEMEEGCLSFPGIYADVVRPKTIKVRYSNLVGEVTTHTYTGLTARCFQHEYDHLQGKVFLSHLSDLKLRRLIEKANKKGFRYTLNMLKNV